MQKEVKEDGPEAARSKKEEDPQKKVEEEKKEVKEGPKKEGRSGLQINANQMQLAVLMAIIAKARAQEEVMTRRRTLEVLGDWLHLAGCAGHALPEKISRMAL